MAAALESFDQVDHAAVDELARLNEERAVVRSWLARMADEGAAVSAAVVERVSRDYEARLAALAERSREPAAAARAEFERLCRLYEETGAALEAATLESEEVELRNRLGEFAAEEYESRRTRCREELERRRAEIADGDRVRSRFSSVLEVERELAGEATPETAPETVPETVPDAAAPSATVLLSKQSMAEVRSRADSAAGKGSAPAAPAGATMILRRAKLVVASGERKDEEFLVSLRGSVLGSAADCDVVLPTDSVAPRHAELSLGTAGYLLRDLGSPAGTRVNGRAVEEAALADGDRLQLGGVELVFRHA